MFHRAYITHCTPLMHAHNYGDGQYPHSLSTIDPQMTTPFEVITIWP